MAMVLDCCCCESKEPAKQKKPNHQKLVDEHRPPYDIFLGKRMLEEEEELRRKKTISKCKSEKIHIRLQCVSKCENIPEPSPKALPNAASKKACYDVSSCPKIAIEMDGKTCHFIPTTQYNDVKPKKIKHKDYLYRCESRELRGSNMYAGCFCLKRNGLQHECPRTPCQGRKACLIKPWPDCWPSGGCHGIDYDRVKGFAPRFNAVLAYRFDNKVCEPPTAHGNECCEQI